MKEMIETQLETHFENKCQFHLVIVRRTEKDLCAIVTSLVRPQFDDPNWKIDEMFLGITPLFTPENADVE